MSSLIEIPDTLYDRLMKKKKDELIDVMLEALDEMQAYNGRTPTYCICVALGAVPEETENGIIYRFKR